MNRLSVLVASLCLGTLSQPSDAADEQLPMTSRILSECGTGGQMIPDVEKRANGGDLEAAYCLGLTYEVDGYHSYGMAWLKKAAGAGFIKAQREFATTLEKHDIREAARWYTKAAYQNDRLSQGVLGLMMYEQWKFQKNEKFLLWAWVWFTVVGYEKFFDTDENGATRIIQLADLLTAEQTEKAAKLLSDLKADLGR